MSLFHCSCVVCVTGRKQRIRSLSGGTTRMSIIHGQAGIIVKMTIILDGQAGTVTMTIILDGRVGIVRTNRMISIMIAIIGEGNPVTEGLTWKKSVVRIRGYTYPYLPKPTYPSGIGILAFTYVSLTYIRWVLFQYSSKSTAINISHA